MNPLNLREKTVVFVGPITPMMQTLLLGMTELGADIGMVNSNIDASQRFASQIMDSREVHPSYGRATALQTDFGSSDDIKEAISRVAESFGGIDTYIDARTVFNLNWGVENAESQFAPDDILHSKLQIADQILPFLKARRKGSVLFIEQKNLNLHHHGTHNLDGVKNLLIPEVARLGTELKNYNLGINVVSVELTEECLLYHFPEKTIQASLTELHKIRPELQTTEFERLKNTICFLTSSMATGLTGQVFELC